MRGNGPPHGATEVTLTSAQCRAGRALIDWSRDQLAGQAGISVRTVLHFERGARGPRPATEDALRRALEAGGVHLRRGGWGRRRRAPAQGPQRRRAAAGRAQRLERRLTIATNAGFLPFRGCQAIPPALRATPIEGSDKDRQSARGGLDHAFLSSRRLRPGARGIDHQAGSPAAFDGRPRHLRPRRSISVMCQRPRLAV